MGALMPIRSCLMFSVRYAKYPIALFAITLLAGTTHAQER